MKAIIAGSTGMLGSHLAAHLVAEGIPVRALLRNKQKIELVRKVFSYYSLEGLMESLVEFVQVDLTDFNELQEIIAPEDWVFNCAAWISFDPRHSKKIIEQNVAVTQTLVNVCIAQNVAAFCHVSSVAALGKNPTGEPVNENCFLKSSEQNSAYGFSKFLSENEVWRGIAEGLKAVIVNPSIILGEGYWTSGSGVFWSIALKSKNRFYPPGAAGFVDVKDVARAMIALVKHQKFGERFIVNAQNLTFFEFFTVLNKSLNLDPPKIKANKLLLEVAWRLNTIFCLIFNKEINFSREIVRSACERNTFDSSYLTRSINFRFSDLNDTINRISKAFLEDQARNKPL